MDLSKVSTHQLRVELARRELAAPPEPPVKLKKWVCSCGNQVTSLDYFKNAFVDGGKVWCRICIPNDRRVIYGTKDRPASVPMVEKDIDE